MTRDGYFVNSEEPEPHWEQEMQTVRLALAQPGNHHTTSSHLGKRASLKHFCKASVEVKQVESVYWSVQVQGYWGEVHKCSQR